VGGIEAGVLDPLVQRVAFERRRPGVAVRPGSVMSRAGFAVGRLRRGGRAQHNLDLADVVERRADGRSQLGQVVGFNPDLVNLARHRHGTDAILMTRPASRLEPTLERILPDRQSQRLADRLPPRAGGRYRGWSGFVVGGW